MIESLKKETHIRNSCTLNKAIADCFEKLTDEELLMLEENHVVLTYKKGETLCKQGSMASHIMYICCGLVKIYMENENNSLILKVLPGGNMIGLTALLEGSNVFKYSAMAYQESRVRLIDINAFKKVISQNSAFAKEVINILCENLIQTQTRFFSYTQKQSYGKLADTLICLSCNIFKCDSFELNLTRKELAELTGLTSESVIRILSKFKADNIIVMEGKTIQIMDMAKLKMISDYG